MRDLCFFGWARTKGQIVPSEDRRGKILMALMHLARRQNLFSYLGIVGIYVDPIIIAAPSNMHRAKICAQWQNKRNRFARDTTTCTNGKKIVIGCARSLSSVRRPCRSTRGSRKSGVPAETDDEEERHGQIYNEGGIRQTSRRVIHKLKDYETFQVN
jgi:hypothetical protein